MANGIPQLLVPKSASDIGRSALTLAQGALWDYLTTETKWGVYYSGTTYPVVLGYVEPSSISGVLGQATSLAGAKALLNGNLLSQEVLIDSVVSLSQKKGSELSNYRLETGSFATFNKVEKPRQIQIRLTKGGTEEERGLFLTWLETRAKGFTTEITTYPKKKLSQINLDNQLGGNTLSLTQINTPRLHENNLFDIYVPEVNYTNMTLVDYTITRESRSGVSLIIADCTFQEVVEITFQYKKSSTDNSKAPENQPALPTSSVLANKPSKTGLDKIKGLLKI
jgi:hypothetical protein